MRLVEIVQVCVRSLRGLPRMVCIVTYQEMIKSLDLRTFGRLPAWDESCTVRKKPDGSVILYYADTGEEIGYEPEDPWGPYLAEYEETAWELIHGEE